MKFSAKMQKHLIDFKENIQYIPATNERKKWEYLEVTDNLYPPIRHGFMQYAYDASVSFHDYARHVRSSQVFGFNIIYPLLTDINMREALVNRLVSVKGEIDQWKFEYQSKKDYLGEWQGPNQPIDYITSVDFAIFVTNNKGKRIAILTEVKFTEEEFTGCGGYKSNGNKNKRFCSEFFDINRVNSECYLTANKGRKYFQLIEGIFYQDKWSRCPFIRNNQCMRNHALAKALIKNDMVDEAYFGLVFHDDNKSIIKEWESYKSMCTESEKDFLYEVKASELISCSSEYTYRKYLGDRYQLKTDVKNH